MVELEEDRRRLELEEDRRRLERKKTHSGIRQDHHSHYHCH